MKTVTYKTGNGATEGRICFMPPAAAVELNAGNDAATEETVWYAASAEDGFAQNTTAWD